MGIEIQGKTVLQLPEKAQLDGGEAFLIQDSGGTKHAKASTVKEFAKPDLSGYETKEHAKQTYQPKGEYLTQEDLEGIGGTPVTDHGTGDTTFELTPNVLHRWGEVASLTLTLGAETPGIVNEYMFQFTSGATATQLSLPETVKWTSKPEIAANTVYQVSIVDNLAVMGGWSNE